MRAQEQEIRSAVNTSFGLSADELIRKWEALDPAGYADKRLVGHKRLVAAVLQENMARSAQTGMWSYNTEMYELLRANRMLSEHKLLDRLVRESAPADQIDAIKRRLETTTTSAVPSIAVQMLPLVTRAVAANPIFDLVTTIPMTGPCANIIYEDFLYDSSGETYSSGTRVDTNEDPTYSDRDDCTANANELRAYYQRETMCASEKVLAAQICLAAEQDAQAQFGVSIEERMRAKIFAIMVREWARLVADDIRTMAGNTTTWSQTAPSPYSGLNTNEWRKVLNETVVVGNAMVEADIFEGTTWLLTSPTIWAILERTMRFEAKGTLVLADPTVLRQVTGEFGEKYDRWTVYRDQFFAANTILLGLTTFTIPEHEGQSPYYFGAYQMADNVSMLFHPRTQMIELGGQTRAARKMIEPNAYVRIDITA